MQPMDDLSLTLARLRFAPQNWLLFWYRLTGNHDSTHFFKSAIQVMAGVSQRLVEFQGNLAQGQPSKEIGVDGSTLLLIQVLDCFGYKITRFFQGKAINQKRVSHQGISVNGFDFHVGIVLAALQVAPMINCFCVGSAQEESPERTARLVELQEIRMNLYKQNLRNIFRFGPIAEYRMSQCQDRFPIAVEKLKKGVLVSLGKPLAQSFIR